MIDDLWYKNAVVYCLDVKTFQDSNGDGIGDFEGLSRRLDYLSGIGVGAVWLLPFYPSPKRDNGYDISDFYGVDPQVGSLGDFVDFSHEARKHGIRVLVDLVVNHTSDQHPWFKAAVKDPASPYRGWYVWSKRKPKDAGKGMVFPGGSGWAGSTTSSVARAERLPERHQGRAAAAPGGASRSSRKNAESSALPASPAFR